MADTNTNVAISPRPVTATPIPTRQITKRPPNRSAAIATFEENGSTVNLTRKMKEFVEFYLQGNSPGKAATMAGYSESLARSASGWLLNHPAVRRELNRRATTKFKQLEITTDKVIDEAAKLAFANALDYIEVDDDRGTFTINLKYVDRDMGAAIQEIGYDVQGRPRIRLADKKSSIELLARIYKMLNEKGDVLPPSGEKPLTISNLDQLIVQINNITQPSRQLTPGPMTIDSSSTRTFDAQRL